MKGIFEIYELTDAIIHKVIASPSPLHRHDFEEFLILTDGKPVHFIDTFRHELETPVIVYVAEGKVHQFLPDEHTKGWVIKYKSEFIPDSSFHYYSFFTDLINYHLGTDFCVGSVTELCKLMYIEHVQNKADLSVVKHLLRALIAKLENERFANGELPGHARPQQKETFNNFLKILQYNYKRPEGVQFYADKLNTSTRNLNLICTAVFGKSVSDIIETRKLIEARQLLLNTTKSVSEIGFELGYNEKSYFTRVFKKKTGVTPTEFRQDLKLMIS